MSPTILLTNDDGSHAPGLLALRDALRALGDVVVVAPDRELSGVGHAITLHQPLRYRLDREGSYVVEGTPTDCVNLAILKILPARPAMVVAGINRGANLGDDVTYSGTVAAAMEGALLGVPSLALSLDGGRGVPPDERVSWEEAASIGASLVAQLHRGPLPERTLLNVNIPGRRPVGPVVVTRQGRRTYEGGIVEKTDPRGRAYYWIGGEPAWDDEAGSDQAAVSRGLVSVTPLSLDLTRHGYLAELGKLLGAEAPGGS